VVVPVALIATGLGTALSGCSDIYFDRRDAVSPSAGDALASNKVVQMVDPWPRHVGNRNIAFNGERLQSAAERYRRHDVIQPIPQNTTLQNSQQVAPPVTTERVPAQPPSAAAAAPIGSPVK
jgi:hypothetical protein